MDVANAVVGMALLVMSPILRKPAAACHKQVAAFRLCQRDAEWILPKALTWCLPATVPPPYSNRRGAIKRTVLARGRDGLCGRHYDSGKKFSVASGATRLAECGGFPWVGFYAQGLYLMEIATFPKCAPLAM